MEPFHIECPKIGLNETRSITLLSGYKKLPKGEYGFVESYCNDPKCDCRRVFLNVISPQFEGEILATINYGWEDIEFYKKWMMGPDYVDELKGPSLAPGMKQSKLAKDLLELFKDEVLSDRNYVKRLKRHYEMFKESIKNKKQERLKNESKEKIGRNAPCPCGSGKKYKNCCMKK
jgi:hypothetical protein